MVIPVEVVNRADAKARGERMYFTGKSCPSGHVSPRFVSNFGCAECLKAGCRTYYQQNTEEMRGRSRAWMKANPERHAMLSRRDYAKHRGARRAASREWSRQNADRLRASNRNSRGRRYDPDGHVTLAEWQSLCERQDYRCCRCGSEGPLTMDHVVPLSLGGRHEIANVQPLCHSCNVKKGVGCDDYR